MSDSRLQQDRLIAAAIDIGIGLGLVVVLLIAGGIIGMLVRLAIGGHGVGSYIGRVVVFGTTLLILVYILGRDTFAGGRSFGKKLRDIRVVTGSGAISLNESVKRNAIFAAGPAVILVTAMIHLVPFLSGLLACIYIPLNMLGVIIGVATVIVEVIKIMQDPFGIRFGDQIANTRVVVE
jgi:hypothetical protein